MNSTTPATSFKIQINVSEGVWRDVKESDGSVEIYSDRQTARRNANEMNDGEEGTFRAVPENEPSAT